MKTVLCSKCNGTGRLPDPPEFGLKMRRERERAGIALRKMAANLDITPGFLCDMEHGRRSWTKDREMAFLEFCREAHSQE